MGEVSEARDCEEMIYLDANFIITTYVEETETGAVLRKFLTNPKEKLATSALTLDEVVYKLSKLLDRKTAIMHCTHLLNRPNLKILPVDEHCTRRMLANIAEYNLKPRDALHLACMQVNNITQIATLDADFDKIKGIKRVKLG